MNKLLTITTAAALIGSSLNVAMAAKPVTGAKLYAGPMHSIQCLISNHSDTTIEVTVNICFDELNSPPDGLTPNCLAKLGAPFQLEPGSHYKTVELGFEILPIYTYTCQVSFQGKLGDITGQACGAVAFVNEVAQYGCTPMQPH